MSPAEKDPTRPETPTIRLREVIETIIIDAINDSIIDPLANDTTFNNVQRIKLTPPERLDLSILPPDHSVHVQVSLEEILDSPQQVHEVPSFDVRNHKLIMTPTDSADRRIITIFPDSKKPDIVRQIDLGAGTSAISVLGPREIDELMRLLTTSDIARSPRTETTPPEPSR